jgi:hypothetical protein
MKTHKFVAEVLWLFIDLPVCCRVVEQTTRLKQKTSTQYGCVNRIQGPLYVRPPP